MIKGQGLLHRARPQGRGRQPGRCPAGGPGDPATAGEAV